MLEWIKKKSFYLSTNACYTHWYSSSFCWKIVFLKTCVNVYSFYVYYNLRDYVQIGSTNVILTTKNFHYLGH